MSIPAIFGSAMIAFALIPAACVFVSIFLYAGNFGILYLTYHCRRCQANGCVCKLGEYNKLQSQPIISMDCPGLWSVTPSATLFVWLPTIWCCKLDQSPGINRSCWCCCSWFIYLWFTCQHAVHVSMDSKSPLPL